ncbi:MAG TPA: 50S ribosomal protein L11 methyltransferase [Burkholderiales bacterium]
MSFSPAGAMRFLLRRARALLKSSRRIRSLIADIDNTEEFSDLYEHEKMIADAVRVDTYRVGIERHVRPGDLVVDLGTGTGILALFAARCGARRVYAIDHSPFIGVAKRIAGHNGVDNITFVRTNSRDFGLPERVDVIVHEQIGDDLFDENMLENLLDLKRRLLRESGRIVPGRFELYLEPVCLKPAYRVPFIWERRVHGIDFGPLKDSEEAARFKRSDYTSRFLQRDSVDYFLCEPAPILAFDLNQMKDASELPRTAELSRPVARAGILDGLCLYFRVIFDDEVSFDTSPLHLPTHWGNRLFRAPQRECRPGDELSVRLDMADVTDVFSWTVDVAHAASKLRLTG